MSGFTKFVKPSVAEPATLSATDYYRRRVERRRVEQVQPGAVPSLDQIADPENLIRVFHQLKQEAGQAPGNDNVTYRDLSPSEVASCMRGLSRIIRHGHYYPAPGRLVQIPKASGKGHRTLTLRNILDRVVSAALHQAMTPFWETIFLPGSMGFRPNNGPWDMLIQLESTMIEKDTWVLAIDDIKDAFDHVVLDDLINDHRRYIQDEALIVFLENNLRGGSQPTRKEGIEQGNAYSPTALNVRLHHVHDLAFQQDQRSPSWFRYADNLVYLTKDVPEGLQALSASKALLKTANFTLKGEDGPPIHLKEGSAHLLGFQLFQRDGQVGYGLTEDAWKGLKLNLERAHEMPNPPEYALQAIQGWLGAYGPAFEGTRKDVIHRVLQIAGHYGFREVRTPDRLWKDWQSSWDRWQVRRKAIC